MNNTKSKPEPIGTLPEDDIPVGARHEKNMIALAAEEDPVIRFFYENQTTLAYLVIGVLVAIISFRWYNSSHQESQARSAELLYNVQSAFDTFDEETNEADLRKFDGAVATLNQQKLPYNLLSNNYSVLKAVKEKDYGLIKSELEGLDWKSADRSEIIWKELLALKLSKSLIDQAEHQDFAFSHLKDLATSASYVQTPAIIAWKSLVDAGLKAESSAELDTLIQEVKVENPEQAELLE